MIRDTNKKPRTKKPKKGFLDFISLPEHININMDLKDGKNFHFELGKKTKD